MKWGPVAVLLMGGALGCTGAWAGTTTAARSAGGMTQPVWLAVRAQLPKSVLVLRPIWLPARFRMAPHLDSVHHEGPAAYVVGYRSVRGDVLLFALGAVNSARPDTRTPIRVRGVAGWIETTPGWPAQAVMWQEGTQHEEVQARGVTRAELLRIVAGMASLTR